MFKINKKIEYALIVLKHLDGLEVHEMATARQICDLYHTPFDSTSKVMQLMNHHGILSSAQGVKGGYQLSTDLNQLPYLKLAELIEGKSFTHNCSNLNCHLIESCNITGPITKLNEYLTGFFKTLSIKELLSEGPLGVIQNNVSRV